MQINNKTSEGKVKKPHGTNPFFMNDVTPFESAEDAWFWFMAAQEAKNEGAKFTAGAGLYKRPCEPIDILKILDRLHRNRRLQRDHLLILRHYGRRHMAPDRFRAKEKRAYDIWIEAMERMEQVMIAKGIVERASDFDFPTFIQRAVPAQEGAIH